MKKLHILVSLTTNDNDYQLEQASAAEKAGHKLGVHAEILYAANDAINQSQQLLKAIQAPPAVRPDAIVFEPVGGTALPQVARAAVAAGIGWVILNRDVDYLAELRRNGKTPVFTVSSDHKEIGRIQGRQLAGLLPKGGSCLYIQGPSDSSAAIQRAEGLQETKPANIQLSPLKAQWTEQSAHKAVSSWMKLTTQKARLDAVAAQDDSMAMGARKAFEELPKEDARTQWLRLPFLGCDGLPKTGQSWVRNGQLAATVIVPPNTSLALEILAKVLQTGTQPPESAYTEPLPYPALPATAAH